MTPNQHPRDPSDSDGPRGAVGRALTRLRLRVVIGYVILLAAALVLSVIATRQVLLTRLDREIDAALSQEVEELEQLASGIDPTTGEPFGSDAEAIFETFLRRNVPNDGEAFYTIVDGRPGASSAEAPAPLLENDDLVAEWAALRSPQARTIDTDAGEARVVAVPLLAEGRPMGIFVIAVFPDEARDEVFQAIRVILVIGLAALVLGSIAAWTAAGRVLRPVRTLTQAARRISDHDLTTRIPVVGNDELSELGATFNAMLDRLEAAFRNQRELLDDVAHELRTPITIVRGHLEVLGDDREERIQTVAVVSDELDRMNRSVSDLLLIAKTETPHFLRLESIDLGGLVDAVFTRARAIADRDWLLERAPRPGSVTFTGDTDRLTQALLNLADNAVGHTDEHDTIAIGAAVVGAEAQLWVRDTGPGVPADDRERIFTRLGRAGEGTRRSDGTGLGLAIVAAIARAHGGHVWLDAQYEDGARFVVSVPIRAPEDPR